MRNATLILALFVLTFTAVAQDIQLPDGNVVQGGSQTQKPADAGTLPPPPPPPTFPGTSPSGTAGGNGAIGATVNPAAGLGDDVAARAAAAMKQLGADPAKNPELFEKLVAHFQQKTADAGVQQGTSVIQGGQAAQDASAQSASRPGAAPAAPQGQGALLAQGQGAGLARQGQAGGLVQQGQGAAIAQTQGSTQVIGETSSYGSSYSSYGSCYSSCSPSYVVVQSPVYVSSYPSYYSYSSCSYPVFRSSSYVSVGFRSYSGRSLVGGGGRLVRGR